MTTRRGFRLLRCAVAGVQAVEAETGHSFPRHMHEQFGIGVIHRGAQKSASGRGPVEAGPGDTITVNPGEVHDGSPIGDAGRSWRMLYFDPGVMTAAVGDITEGRTGYREFSRPVMSDAGLADSFLRLFSAMTMDEAPAGIRQEERLLLLLADGLCERGAAMDQPPVPRSISRARSLIDDDPAAVISLSDLARESGLSRFQVVRGFSRATGLTPHAYLVQRRIHAARRLIGQGVALAEAAAASGFADQSHMTRIFTRQYGVSPGRYADAVT
jgi:AraC-like DNA-binding protein/quercetin dioxygenase-like cupin family protein